MGFNGLKATEPLHGGSLSFTTKFPEIPGTLGPLDCKSSALTTRPLLCWKFVKPKAKSKSSNHEELVKHITSEFTEFDEATCNNITGKLVNENKLIENKYAKKILSTNNRTDYNKKNPDIEHLQAKSNGAEGVCFVRSLSVKEGSKDITN